MRLVPVVLLLILVSTALTPSKSTIRRSIKLEDSIKADTANLLKRPRVLLTFIVEIDSSISNITGKIDRCDNCTKQFRREAIEEAITLLKKTKKWSPGIQNGKPVRVKYTLPLVLNFDELNAKKDSLGDK